MNYLKIILLSTLLYAGIEDMFFMSISLPNWVLIHVILVLINWKVVFILPFYYLVYKFSKIGLADWIVILCAIVMVDSYFLFLIISYILLLSNIDINTRKTPAILPLTMGIIIAS